MSRNDFILLVEDMLESANKIVKYTHGYDLENFLNDDRTIDAVVRNFEIIGEAANRISPEIRNDYPEIAWRRIRGFRNRIVHEYFGIDHEIVWSIITSDIEELIFQLQSILDKKS